MGEPKSSELESKSNSGLLKILGPGLITACVVIGPGSILTSSKVGATYGYQLVWVLLIAVILMMIYMTLGARLGVIAKATPADLLTERVGRWLPACIGVAVFCIASSYQFGNNLGAASAFDVFIDFENKRARAGSLIGITLLLNLAAIGFLFAFKDLYRWLEMMMATFVGLMLLAFIVNLGFAGFQFGEFFTGFIPSLPTSETGERDWVTVIGWVGTTFIPAIAYYQAYLVRHKGWGREELQTGKRDARVGAIILAMITLMIMSTAASVLRGEELSSVGDVAQQLRPLFKGWGQTIFCIGLFAAAYSSFLINSMAGGFLLADGLKLGSTPQSRWPRIFTASILVIGWVVASISVWFELKPVAAIVFAQAITVLAAPLIGGVLWWLTSRRDIMGDDANRWPTHLAAGSGLVMLIILSGYLIYRITSTIAS